VRDSLESYLREGSGESYSHDFRETLTIRSKKGGKGYEGGKSSGRRTIIAEREKTLNRAKKTLLQPSEDGCLLQRRGG